VTEFKGCVAVFCNSNNETHCSTSFEHHILSIPHNWQHGFHKKILCETAFVEATTKLQEAHETNVQLILC